MEASGAFQCPRSPWPGHSCSTQKSPGALRPDFELRLHRGPQRKPTEDPPPRRALAGDQAHEPSTRPGLPRMPPRGAKHRAHPQGRSVSLQPRGSAPGSEGQQPSLAPGPLSRRGQVCFPSPRGGRARLSRLLQTPGRTAPPSLRAHLCSLGTSGPSCSPSLAGAPVVTSSHGWSRIASHLRVPDQPLQGHVTLITPLWGHVTLIAPQAHMWSHSHGFWGWMRRGCGPSFQLV